MAMNFLRRIEDPSFPLLIHEEADIQCAATLAAAQLVKPTCLSLVRHTTQGR